MVKCSTKWISALCLFFLFSFSALAQTYRAHVRGIVTDQSKSVLPGATVTLQNVNTGVSMVRQTSEAGLYVFDLVDPGKYTITVDAAGFGKFVQDNVLVQSGGDITVDAALSPGTLQQTVTVEATPSAVEFNSANKELTIDTKMAQETPRIDRNPFKLTLIEPQAVNTRGEMLPYNSWAANSVDLGGGTNLQNDLLVDGSPIGIGHKDTYPPNTDAVQEVIVSTNSVDAESGHSAGGVISLATKSGTNDWHGEGFYLGRYPWLNATADRTRFSQNANRQNMFGGTFGNPILKNKLFNFFSYERWLVGTPQQYVRTVPTALERQGDFSQSRNIDGGLRTIYDPYASQFNPATGAVRTPFPGNRIPQSQMDPLAASIMSQFWDPNTPGDNITGVNNFKKGYTENFDYYNFSDRVDYNISDKWRVSGHYGRYYVTDDSGDPTPNHSQLYVPTGTLRYANQAAGDAVWTINPTTVVNFHGSWQNVGDAFVSKDLGSWSSIWPNNNFYKAYQDAAKNVRVYYPALNIGGQGYGGPGYVWDQRPAAEAFSTKISKQVGSHFLKAGFDFRRSAGPTLVTGTSQFTFNSDLTAPTSVSPDTLHYGDQFATFLLGALDTNSEMIGGPAPNPMNEFYGMFIQDDWKLNRRITLNLGLRNEYETAWHDPDHLFSRGLDLNAPIPEMLANPPQMPGQVASILPAGYQKYVGQWQFTDSQHPGMWSPQALALQPRVGIAIRIDDKTALRAGYALYTAPTEYNFSNAPVSGYEAINFLEPPFFGQTGYQYVAPLQQGVPQATLSNPFPASNPLVPIQGKAIGGNLGRGGQDLLWYPQNFQKAYNNRINISFQRELPGQLVAAFTFFTNFGNRHFTENLNNIDPRLQVQYQNQLDTQVANPFYNYLTPTLFPGPLRNQPTVSLGSLLVPYPQYGRLYTLGNRGASERYNSYEVKVQKNFSKGYNFFASYIYINERVQQPLNQLDQYTNTLQWQDSNQPRHRFNVAGTYQLPFGKGRHFMSNAPRVVDALLGGWQVTGLSTFYSGDYLRFPGDSNVSTAYIVTGNPCISNPTPQHWFNTAAFQQVPSNTFVIRSNPLQYGCLTGPKFYNLDATLLKSFNITERVHTELKMSAYNATNRLNLGDPDTSVTSSTFGQALYQGSPGGQFGSQTQQQGNLSGRQVELGLKIVF
jgi:hypothetical protein